MLTSGTYEVVRARMMRAWRAARWGEVTDLGRLLQTAIRSVKAERPIPDRRRDPSTSEEAETLRAKRAGLTPGTELVVHRRVRGERVELRCVWLGPTRWLFSGVEYASPTAAARAATGGERDGWHFWNIEKRD
jgi:hypothetical protein